MSAVKKTLLPGLIAGTVFGFLLQKGGVTKYEVLIGQLRLTDFTVIKIILSAIIVTTLGISYLYPKGRVKLHVKSGSIRNSVIGGLIFGVGFGISGYCPGTIAGAVGNGSLDALFGGVFGILLGSGLYAALYQTLKEKRVLVEDKHSGVSMFDKMKHHPLVYTIPLSFIFIAAMLLFP